MFRLRLRALIALVIAATAFAAPAPEPRAVVLVIGDGVSIELLTAARIYKHGAQGRLALERYPHTGLVRTWSANSMVTDSSSAATALARGIKAVNGRVGIPEAGKPGPESLLDIAKRRGWSTGIVTDDSVTGGTPSPFIVEEDDRKASARIASKTAQELGKRVDVLLGGGAAWFREEPGFSYAEGDAAMVRETAAKLAAAQIPILDTWEKFNARPRAAGGPGPVLGLFSPDTRPFAADGARTPTLLEMAQAAVRELQARGKPFFLMVEAGLPDKAEHQNEGVRAVNEVLEMDSVLDWLDQTLSADSLILATADHETGGVAVNGYLPLKARGNTLFVANPGNGLPVLSFATGPGGPKPGEATRPQEKNSEAVQPGDTQPAVAYTGSAMHTGGDVWLIGRGPGSEEVRGFLDNTDIFGMLRGAVLGEPFTRH